MSKTAGQKFDGNESDGLISASFILNLQFVKILIVFHDIMWVNDDVLLDLN